MPRLPEAEPRLQRRYKLLVVAHLNPADYLAAGLHPPPSLVKPFAAIQGAWRFYANPNITLAQLAGPLVQAAREQMASACDAYGLVVMDWCHLHFNGHRHARDRVALAHKKDLGYEMLSALLLSDRDGQPIGPLGVEVRAAEGIHATRSSTVLAAVSQLDGLSPLMEEAQSHELIKPLVFIIDAEADSVGHYRQWDRQGRRFLVRANAARKVLYHLQEMSLGKVADQLQADQQLLPGPCIDFKGRKAFVFVGHTQVVLARPARTNRVGSDGKKRHHNIAGPAITLRLVVSQVRDGSGKVLARWLLLSNLAQSVDAQVLAQWYCWRWQIESCHKLLKGSGHFIEQWQQESALAVSKRLLIALMACVIVWQLARDAAPAAVPLRELLVRLSGRQIKRGKNKPAFTMPSLLAGLGILLPMLHLLEQYDPSQLRAMLTAVMPNILSPRVETG